MNDLDDIGPVFRHEEEDVEYRWLESPARLTKSLATYHIEKAKLNTVSQTFFANFQDQVAELSRNELGDSTFNPEKIDEAIIIMWQMLFARHVDNCICYFEDIVQEIIELDDNFLGKILGFNFVDKFRESDLDGKLDFYKKAKRKLSIKNMDEFLKLSESVFGFTPFPLDGQPEMIRSHIQVRDMIVHNRGIADIQFRRYQALRKNHRGPLFPLGVRYINPSPMKTQFDLDVAICLFDKVLCKKPGMGVTVGVAQNAQ